MKYIKSPTPRWLNEPMLWAGVRTVLRVAFWLIVLAALYYSAVYQLIGPMAI